MPYIEGKIRKVKDSGRPIVTRAEKPPKGMTKDLDKRNFYLYDPKGYSNILQCSEGLRNHINILKKAGIQRSALGLDNWGPHIGVPFGTLAAKAKIKLIFVPACTTELTAPIDVGAGQFVKLYVTKCYEKWLEDNIQEHEAGNISAAERRILLSKWVADGVVKLKKEYNIVGCFQRCAFANCMKGCENFKVRVPSKPDYTPPQPGDPKIVTVSRAKRKKKGKPKSKKRVKVVKKVKVRAKRRKRVKANRKRKVKVRNKVRAQEGDLDVPVIKEVNVKMDFSDGGEVKDHAGNLNLSDEKEEL